MPTDLERLVVSLEARINSYEKSMNKALGISNKNAKAIESRWKKLDIGASAFAGFAKGAVSSLVPVLTLGAAIQKTKQALQEFGDIADNARASGLDPETFQALAYQAQLGGVAFDQMSSALSTFAKNAGLAVVEKGRMYSALKVLNPELLKSIVAAQSQEDRVRLAADAISRESDASRRAALSTTLFGDAGAKLADVFSTGARGIEETAAAARKLGLVVDNELIARADQMGDEFETATRVLDLQFMKILVELAPVLTATANGIAAIIEQVKALMAMLPPLGELMRMSGLPVVSNIGLDMLKGRAAELSAGPPPVDITVRGGTPEQEEFSSGFGDPGADDRAKAALKEAEAVRDLIEELKFENSLIGKSVLEQEKLRAARQAGAAATAAQQEEIAKLTEEGYRHNQQVEAMTALYDELGNIGKAAVQGIVDALADGKVEGEELQDVLSNVLSMASSFFLNQAFGGGGGGGGNIFGTLFGGGRASGGPVQAGKVYKVNENTPNSEYFAPGMDGMIIPKLSKQGGGSMGGPVFHIDARGAQQGVGIEIRRALEDFSRLTLPTRVNQIVADPHARG